LDAWQPLAGSPDWFTAPAVAWQHFVGAVETLLIATPGSGGAIDVPIGEPVTDTADPAELSDPRWGLVPAAAELAGKMQPIQHTITVTYAHVLPDEPGLQRLEFESSFNKPTVGGAWAPTVGRCQAWRNGQWETVWETEPIYNLFHPLPIVGDFDADGKPEVAILPWYELFALDAATGQIKDRCRFNEGRAYGFFGAYDLDGDGKTEFVVQADYSKHVDVLGYRDGKLASLWHKNIELGFGNPQKVLRVGLDPVADVDGDGKLEVLVNLYNDTGDERWHVTVHDGLTGEVRADLPDVHLDALADVNGDGIAELLVTRTAGQGLPAFGPSAVYTVAGGTAMALWEDTAAGWQTWNPPQPGHVNSSATLANRTVLWRPVEKRGAVALRRAAQDSAVTVAIAVWEEGGFREQLSVTGRLLEGVGIDPHGALLARCVTRPGQTAQATARQGTLRAVSSRRLGIAPGTIVVAKPQGAAVPALLVQGYGEELVAFSAPGAGQLAAELRRWPGRGQSTNWPGQAYGPVLADLSGDGRRQCLYATAAPDGSARLVAEELDGRPVWYHDFPRFPGGAPIWNIGGLILWQVGHFTDPARQDVIVTLRRSIMHSDETHLLSGRDGQEIWHRDHQLYDRGAGGQPFAIADYDADGLDEACSLYPDLFYILEGTDGKDHLTPKQGPYWGQPIAGDWESTGKPTVFFATERASLTALYRINGTLAWLNAQDKSPSSLAAFGDFDGDGQLEAIGVGYPDGIRCYATATGKVKWSLPAPVAGNPAGSASGDLNGDGRDEAIFVTDKTIWCLGTGGRQDQGAVLWQVELPAKLGPPTLADPDGAGRPAVLVAASDGFVYCVR